MSLDTFSTLRQRVNYLIGDTTNTTAAIIDSHINSAIRDIVNAYPFSWNVTKNSGGTISGSTPEYSFNLASDFNVKWHLVDARILGANVGDDHVFTEIAIVDRDSFGVNTYKYWITYDTVNKVYVFNTKESSGTVPYYYYFLPTTLTSPTDTSIIPDSEAVCYLAASKNWITDERNQGLAQNYKQEASTRIQSMWQVDNAFGPTLSEGSVVDYNSYLSQQ